MFVLLIALFRKLLQKATYSTNIGSVFDPGFSFYVSDPFNPSDAYTLSFISMSIWILVISFRISIDMRSQLPDTSFETCFCFALFAAKISILWFGRDLKFNDFMFFGLDTIGKSSSTLVVIDFFSDFPIFNVYNSFLRLVDLSLLTSNCSSTLGILSFFSDFLSPNSYYSFLRFRTVIVSGSINKISLSSFQTSLFLIPFQYKICETRQLD